LVEAEEVLAGRKKHDSVLGVLPPVWGVQERITHRITGVAFAREECINLEMWLIA
jgi:hypothetical protein